MMITNDIILIYFIIFNIYIIVNCILFIIYKKLIKKGIDFYEYFYDNNIRKKILLYMFLTIFIISYNILYKDNIKLKYYNYKLKKIRYGEDFESELNEIKKLIHQTERRIKIKKFK